MNRREFIKDVAVGSIALTTLPTLLNAVPKVAAEDGGGTKFTFVTDSVGSSGTFLGDRLFMTGAGSFGGGGVQGGGSFDHFNGSFSVLKASGSWVAEEFIGFTPGTDGVVGALEGGALVIRIKLQPTGGSEIPATLTQNCHGFGGPAPEGIILVVGDTTFNPFSTPPSATLFAVSNQG